MQSKDFLLLVLSGLLSAVLAHEFVEWKRKGSEPLFAGGFKVDGSSPHPVSMMPQADPIYGGATLFGNGNPTIPGNGNAFYQPSLNVRSFPSVPSLHISRLR